MPTHTTTPVTFDGYRLAGYTEHPRMSEETTAFDADVYLGDEKVGAISNTGRGGESTFTANSPENRRAFLTAEQNFPGIPDTACGGTMGLIDALAETAAAAKLLGGRTIKFVPNTTVNDFVTGTGDVQAYQVASRAGESAHDAAHEVMRQVEDVQTLLYPAREKKGYWLHVATR